MRLLYNLTCPLQAVRAKAKHPEQTLEVSYPLLAYHPLAVA